MSHPCFVDFGFCETVAAAVLLASDPSPAVLTVRVDAGDPIQISGWKRAAFDQRVRVVASAARGGEGFVGAERDDVEEYELVLEGGDDLQSLDLIPLVDTVYTVTTESKWDGFWETNWFAREDESWPVGADVRWGVDDARRGMSDARDYNDVTVLVTGLTVSVVEPTMGARADLEAARRGGG